MLSSSTSSILTCFWLKIAFSSISCYFKVSLWNYVKDFFGCFKVLFPVSTSVLRFFGYFYTSSSFNYDRKKSVDCLLCILDLFKFGREVLRGSDSYVNLGLIFSLSDDSLESRELSISKNSASSLNSFFLFMAV